MKKTLKNLLLTLSLCSETLVAGWAQQEQVTNVEEVLAGMMNKLDVVPYAYQDRPVTSSAMFGIGGATLHDTYLTNQLYDGTSVNLSLSRYRVMKRGWLDKDQWFDLSYASVDDKASGANSMIAFRVRYVYAMHKFWNLPHQRFSSQNSRFSAGLYSAVNLGADYSLSMGSGNNPANAHYTLNLGLSAGYQWDFRLRQRPAAVRLQVQTPFLGMAFSPKYAQSYYEMYLGSNTRNENMYFSSLHNQQDLDVRCTADIPIRVIFPLMDRYCTSVRVGVNYHIETQKINHLIGRYSYCQAVIGWTWQHSPLKGHRL